MNRYRNNNFESNNFNNEKVNEIANKFKDFIVKTYNIKNDTVTKLEKSMVKQLYTKHFSNDSQIVDFMQVMTILKTLEKACDEINGYLLWGTPELIVNYLFTNDVSAVKHANYFLSRFQHFCHACNMGFENGRGWRQHLFGKKHQINQFKIIIMKYDRSELVKDKSEVQVTSKPLCDVNGNILVSVETNKPLVIPFYIRINDPYFTSYSVNPLYENKNFAYNEAHIKESGFLKHEFKFKEQTQFGHQFYPIIFKFDTSTLSRTVYILRIIEVNIVGELYTKLAPKEEYKKKELLSVPDDTTTISGLKLPVISNSSLKIKELDISQYAVPLDIKRFLATATTSEMTTFENKLKQSKTSNNYFDIFTRLLCLEEFQLDKDIRFYDMKDVKFNDAKRKVYLHLDAPGTIDNRPSVMIGDVLFVYIDKIRKKRYEAVVHEINDGSTLKLGLNDEFPYIKNKLYDIEFTYDKSAFGLMHKALCQYLVNKHLYEKVLFPISANFIPVKSESPAKTVQTWYDRNLNEEQKQAVVNILNNTSKSAPFIIYGPPGTGKTVTLVESIKQIYNESRTNYIIACASNNLAADLLAQRLIIQIDKSTIIRLYNRTRSFTQVPNDILHISNFDHIKKSIYFPSTDKLQSYRIIVCSLVTYGRLLSQSDFDSKHVTHIFIDEAAQSLEPELLIPIIDLIKNNNSCKVILAGDPKQLGPIVHSPIAKQVGLELSLLERLITQNNVYCESKEYSSCVYNERMCVKLVNNYRSHNKIIEIPRRLFYDGVLNECAGEFRNLFINLKWPLLPNKTFPCIFHPVYGKEEQEGDSPSFFNLAEVETIDLYLKQLLNDDVRDKKLKFLKPSQIGVISPYRGQLQKIKKVIEENKYGNDIKVGSVEEFQGQERCVIIISSVRSFNSISSKERKLKVGFLNNPKRFNVAITRAQALIIIVGNPFMLKADENWETFLKYLKENKAWANVATNCFNAKNQNEYQELTNLFDQIRIRDNDEDESLGISETTLKEHLEWPKYD